jgi:glycosyltransferase involved in cell wall biosynthesis
MDPFISVIIPTFNRKEALQRAVASVMDQSFKDWELIIVDDGSNDGTDLSGISSLTNRTVRAVRLGSNRGVSAARNVGASHARGAWLAFLDSDDCWHRAKLEKQVAWAQEHPEYRINQTREIWIRRGKRVNPPRTHEKKHGDIFEESLERCMITPSSVVLHKGLFDEAGGFNESLPACEDYDLWLRITCRYPVGLIDDYLLTRYGGADDQLSATVFAPDRFRIRALLDLLARAPLSRRQRELAVSMLVRKSSILANGYKKHGKVSEYEHYRAIAEQFSTGAA